MTEIPKAIWDGSFSLFGVEVKCVTLEDGQRLIFAESMDALLKAMAAEGNDEPGEDIVDFSKWQSGK